MIKMNVITMPMIYETLSNKLLPSILEITKRLLLSDLLVSF